MCDFRAQDFFPRNRTMPRMGRATNWLFPWQKLGLGAQRDQSHRRDDGLRSVQPALVDHGQIVVERDVVGYGVPRAEAETASRLTSVDRPANAITDGFLVAAAEEIDVHPA